MAVLRPPDMDDSLARHCAEMAEPEKLQFGISLCVVLTGLDKDGGGKTVLTKPTGHRFICIGILISYLPQHYNLIKRRSSAGISPYFVLLGTTSVSFSLAYILALPQSRMDMACCRVNSELSCFAGVLGIAQISVQWACFWLMYALLSFRRHD